MGTLLRSAVHRFSDPLYKLTGMHKKWSMVVIPVRCQMYEVKLDPPKPGEGKKQYRRIVHYPENYTVEPLRVTRLGGRDPVTGRVVAKGIGGGLKYKVRWVDYKREGPKEGPPIVERVITVLEEFSRTANVALVGRGDKLRYILATENMKPGDIIKTSGNIPRIAVKANEGDAYPLGALPVGTKVHCVEILPGMGGYYAKAAGTFCNIVRKVGDRVVIQIPSKREMSLKKECMAVVGRLSNIAHADTPIGSARRSRQLGNRPRSGLWQRKTGRFGRKIKPPRPVKIIEDINPKPRKPMMLTL